MLGAEGLRFEYVRADAAATVRESVLCGIDLHIEKGSFVAIIGRNGSGKSTLAKHFNAMLLPTGGRVYVDGIDTRDEARLFDIRSRAGMVFQNPDNQIVAAIVEDDVAFAAENLGVEPQEIRRRVDDALKAVGMTEYAQAEPSQLSGGQKQRVAIAGVLAMEPECIILDEPTAMLDPSGRAEVIAAVRRINREKGITIVLITHFMDEAALADRVVVTDSGRVVADDVPRRVFARAEELEALGLDVPQATRIALALRRDGFDIRGDVLTVEECADEIMRLAARLGRVRR